jgi:hypothetical protein
LDPALLRPALVSKPGQATEVVCVYFPSSYTSAEQETFTSRFENFCLLISETAAGFLSFVGGWAEDEYDVPTMMEKGKLYLALLGWESVKAHKDYAQTPSFKENVHLLREAKQLKHLSVFHVHAQDFEKSD